MEHSVSARPVPNSAVRPLPLPAAPVGCANAARDRAAAVRAGAASEALHLLALNRPAKLAELDALKARVQAAAAHAAAGRREEQ